MKSKSTQIIFAKNQTTTIISHDLTMKQLEKEILRVEKELGFPIYAIDHLSETKTCRSIGLIFTSSFKACVIYANRHRLGIAKEAPFRKGLRSKAAKWLAKKADEAGVQKFEPGWVKALRAKVAIPKIALRYAFSAS